MGERGVNEGVVMEVDIELMVFFVKDVVCVGVFGFFISCIILYWISLGENILILKVGRDEFVGIVKGVVFGGKVVL